jgi:hypothetical protein
MSAIGEGILVAPVFRIGDLRQALIAGCQIRRQADINISIPFTGKDCKRTLLRDYLSGFPFDAVNLNIGRPVGFKPLKEIMQGISGSLNFDQHTLGMIADETGQSMANRQPVYERPESDSLDNSGD